MALIKCPACGKTVSDKAVKCPHCGKYSSLIESVSKNKVVTPQVENNEPISQIESESEDDAIVTYLKEEGHTARNVLIGIIATFFVIAFMLYFYNNSKTVTTSSDSDVTQVLEDDDSDVVGDFENDHEWVDLGLSVKWATCNVGASTPEEDGDYFAWGETEPKSEYNWSTYKWCNGSDDTMTKYCASSSYGTVDNKLTLDLADDAAHANWGGSWRMPTYDELKELEKYCTWTWTTQNGVDGYKVTSKKNGNSIFLPAAGFRCGSYLNYEGSLGNYWSSSLYSSDSDYAYCLDFNSSNVSWYGSTRCGGLSVRAVCP